MLTTIGSQRTRPHDRRDGFAKEILNQRAGECCGVDAAHRPYTLRGGPWTQHSLAVGRGHRRNGITACAARKSLSARNIARTRRARARAGSCTAHQSAGIEMHSTYASADRTRAGARLHMMMNGLAHLPADPHGCASRPPSKVNIEDLQMLFEKPQPEAAKTLGISLTTLKQVCRRLGVSRWPYRRPSNPLRGSRPRPDVETPQGAEITGLVMNQLNPASGLPPLPMPTHFPRPGGVFKDCVRNGLLDIEAGDAAGAWAHGASPMKFAGLNAGTGLPTWPEQGAAVGRRHAGLADLPAPKLMSDRQPQPQALSRGYHPGIHNRMPLPGPGLSPSNIHDPTVQNAHLGRLRLDPRIEALGCHPNSGGMGTSGPAQYQAAGGWTMDQAGVRSQDGSARGFQAGPFPRGLDAEHRNYFDLSFAEHASHRMWGLGGVAAEHAGHRMGLSGESAEHGGHRMGLGGVAAGVSAILDERPAVLISSPAALTSYLAIGDQPPDLGMVGGGIGRGFRAGDNAFLRHRGQSATGTTMRPWYVHESSESFGGADPTGDSHPMFSGATAMPLSRELGNSGFRQGRQDATFGDKGLGRGTFNPDM